MPKTIVENQFLREFRELSPAGRGEVFKYARWLLDIERQESLTGSNDSESEDMSRSLKRKANKRLLLIIRKWFCSWCFHILTFFIYLIDSDIISI